jgi:anti-anti-sigma regulatory factor
VSRKKPPRAAKASNTTRPELVELDARMTIVNAADLHRRLLTRLEQGAAVVVDGSRVEEIDTSILQLLVSLWRTASQRGVACAWAGSSNALRQSADLIGVAEMLHFPDAAA